MNSVVQTLLNKNRDVKYVKVHWEQPYEYKEGDIVSMQGFDYGSDGDYEVVSFKQLDQSTVELKVERKR
jgi:hypothetical protein